VEYVFALPEGREHRFTVDLHRPSTARGKPGRAPGSSRAQGGSRLPVWTELGSHRCSNCTLDPGVDSHCPPAVDSLEILDAFKDAISYTSCRVRVRTAEREYSKSCDMQTALRSLLGLVMATSGCPQLSSLRGMAMSHLPFATLAETVYRTTTHHLLKQFFVNRAGGKADLDLSELGTLYEELQVVNSSFLERVRAATERDASLNALLNLLSVSMMVGFSLDDGLLELEGLFLAPGAPVAAHA
jgi:hypothetical protein